jgi:hypothetical protein
MSHKNAKDAIIGLLSYIIIGALVGLVCWALSLLAFFVGAIAMGILAWAGGGRLINLANIKNRRLWWLIWIVSFLVGVGGCKIIQSYHQQLGLSVFVLFLILGAAIMTITFVPGADPMEVSYDGMTN